MSNNATSTSSQSMSYMGGTFHSNQFELFLPPTSNEMLSLSFSSGGPTRGSPFFKTALLVSNYLKKIAINTLSTRILCIFMYVLLLLAEILLIKVFF
jgi:hypothetical protein